MSGEQLAGVRSGQAAQVGRGARRGAVGGGAGGGAGGRGSPGCGRAGAGAGAGTPKTPSPCPKTVTRPFWTSQGLTEVLSSSLAMPAAAEQDEARPAASCQCM